LLCQLDYLFVCLLREERSLLLVHLILVVLRLIRSSRLSFAWVGGHKPSRFVGHCQSNELIDLLAALVEHLNAVAREVALL